ncbi:MAG: homoserine kinase [Xanthomonadales bacterium]|nr:homoserine kinase [Xanthomonadales bacterium]
MSAARGKRAHRAQVGGFAQAQAPGSVGNVGVGFDILGHAVEGVGDRVMVEAIAEPVVRISAISGLVTELPRDSQNNTAARAVSAMREALGLENGFEIALEKGIPLGSGLGGSAASAVAAVVAANALLDQPLELSELYPFALAGEVAASGSAHGDNIAPQLLGGLVLVCGERLIQIPVPDELYCAVVHPHLVVETREARKRLRAPYGLSKIVAQTGNLAGVLAGLYRNDMALIGQSLSDVLVEPRRAVMIPGFAKVKAAALERGALGASISGGGPSVFAWFSNRLHAQSAGVAMRQAFEAAGLKADLLVSPVAAAGAGVL